MKVNESILAFGIVASIYIMGSIISSSDSDQNDDSANLTYPDNYFFQADEIHTAHYTSNTDIATDVRDNLRKSTNLYHYYLDITPEYNSQTKYELVPQGRYYQIKPIGQRDNLYGHFEWDCEEYLPTAEAQYEYLKRHPEIVNHRQPKPGTIYNQKLREIEHQFGSLDYFISLYEDYGDLIDEEYN